MRPEEVTVRALLTGILLFIVGITGKVLVDVGLQAYLIILWCSFALLAGLAAAGPLGMVPKEWSVRFGIVASCLLLITIVLQAKLIPICGDNVCGAGECDRCARDCTPALCGDGTCQPKVERCDTSEDCACGTNDACAPMRNMSDAQGCVEIACGDGFCDGQETSESCCKDCGCQAGYLCERNMCFFEVPRVTLTPYTLTDHMSATSLAGNPMLTDASGTPQPFLRIDLRSSKSVENVNAQVTIPGILTDNIPVGTMYAEQELRLWRNLKPDPRLMAVTQDTRTNLTVTLTYTDAFGNRYAMNRSVPFTVLSRNTLDDYGHIALFTGSVPTQASTPEGIWDELGKEVRVVPQSRKDIVQFPQETLEKGSGSPQDVAVLLVSAYSTAGVRAQLVDTAGGYSVRVWNGERFIIIDPSSLGRPFDDALSFTPGYAVYDINQTFTARNFTRVSS